MHTLQIKSIQKDKIGEKLYKNLYYNYCNKCINIHNSWDSLNDFYNAGIFLSSCFYLIYLWSYSAIENILSFPT